MAVLPERTLLAIMSAFIGLLFLGEWRLVVAFRKQEAGGRDRLMRAHREERELESASPSPTLGNAERIAADLARARRNLAALRLKCRVAAETIDGSGALPRTTQSEAFFAIGDFIQRMRLRVAAAGAALSPEERFGFAAYAAEGPPAPLLPAVLRQQRCVEAVLEVLCAAGPQELLAVRREAPFATSGPVGSRGRTIAAPEARAGSDYFVMAPTLSARAPGLLRTTAIRLVFAGSTRSLRAFLSGLAQGAEVAAVRSIEVESAGGGNGTAGVRRDAVPAVTPAADPTVPIVHAPVSIFTVTMEFLEAVAAENGPAAPAATVATAP